MTTAPGFSLARRLVGGETVYTAWCGLPAPIVAETMAREGLNITAVIWANRTYQMLKGEFDNVGAGRPGQKANDMLEIGRPDLDWAALATGMGVPASRVADCESLTRQLQRGLAEPGPYLIEAML